jgi:hypothetical protein
LWNLLGTLFLVVMVGYLLFYLVKRGRSGFGKRVRTDFIGNASTGLRNFLAYYFVNAFRFLNSLWGTEEQIEEQETNPRSERAGDGAS